MLLRESVATFTATPTKVFIQEYNKDMHGIPCNMSLVLLYRYGSIYRYPSIASYRSCCPGLQIQHCQHS